MRPVGPGAGPAARRNLYIDDAGAPIDAVLSRAELEVEDGVEVGAVATAGEDAVATGGRGGRARDAAVAMFGALVRAEIPPLRADFGAFTDALAAARAQTAGDLGNVLDKYIAMRRRIAQHVGSISSG